MTAERPNVVAWLVEMEMFPQYQHQLCEEIRRQGHAGSSAAAGSPSHG